MTTPLVISWVAILLLALFVWHLSRRYSLVSKELRRQQDRTADYQKRELQRQEYCNESGHDLDRNCLCRRCLISQHTWESTGFDEYWVEDEPGALYLSSDFQPTGHYEQVERFRCTRCEQRI